MTVGFDAASNVSRFISKIAGRVSFVGRYLASNVNKNIGSDEARTLTNAGISVVSVFEDAGDMLSTFTAANGTRDARIALSRAMAAGQPSGSCVYFAVDLDVTGQQLIQNVVPYFKAVNAVMMNHYAVGVYGSGLVCSTL